ncbi:hypothetical protein Y032_0555g3376 [Ancylostoma ceylanicum]|uniref:Uncharacterized protein n=1 Tax=Ancylostoma ceylanicum TaxID=53326 RepID=A0A016WQ74_9BILA|nr:hypothetical protein Y032_0555g3376 [Ancylostoma ceylanicum]
MLQYAAFHQVAVVCDESIASLKLCRSHHIFPIFIDNLLLNVPHKNNDEVRIGIARLKLIVTQSKHSCSKTTAWFLH